MVKFFDVDDFEKVLDFFRQWVKLVDEFGVECIDFFCFGDIFKMVVELQVQLQVGDIVFWDQDGGIDIDLW